MKSAVLLWLLLLSPFFFISADYAQTSPTTPQVAPRAETPAKPMEAPVQAPSEDEKQQMLDNCKRAYDELAAKADSKGYAAWQDYKEYYYRTYQHDLAESQLNAFKWQATASKILIWVVVIVCLSGVVFSGYQLWRATAPGPVGGGADGKTADPLATNVELSWQNVRVTSSVIGLVVLVISVAYLYLFLKEVYHIEMVGDLTSKVEKAAKENLPGPAPGH
jgi:hypothetical protein